ncbi:hypothetical protein CC80DRAFT_421097 [Byssothecium circinans]|uniref:Ataxin-10 homolog n=1 Tax=Byssothecium circinans TaxID=147558 RepID=A0A6A5TMS5_9PLEO|nr:hypothetical protein CC80DRAFT_421097 [Byssothecium circinans]
MAAAVEERRPPQPYLMRIRLGLAAYLVHFKYNYMREETMRVMEQKNVKRTLQDSRQSFEIREEIGLADVFWDELAGVLKAAVPSLSRRSFAAPETATPDYEDLSGPLIAACSASLLTDLDRLDSLVSIARNLLANGEKVQNLAATKLFDKDVFALINVCVRVTARGYDGEANTSDEDKWQSVINAYKKLLITCLQFLNNLIARNEQRKLMLWIELFDSHVDNELPNFADMKYNMDVSPRQERDAPPKDDAPVAPPYISRGPDALKIPQQPASSPFLLYIGETGNHVKKWLAKHGQKAGANEIAAECRRRWQTMAEEDKNKWNMLYAEVVAKYRDDLTNTHSNSPKNLREQHARNEESVQALADSISQLQVEVDRMRSSIAASNGEGPAPPPEKETEPAKPVQEHSKADPGINRSPPAGEVDFRVTYPPSFGAEILQNGKKDLLKRLEPDPDRPAALTSDVASPNSPPPEDDDNEDDYDDSGDEGHGLLTDVPLILGPTEIEVLPMIIMAGIVEPAEGQPGYHSDPAIFSSIRSMHSVRCHLLLAQDNGRNLLRELLIFVAAWDLREDELYFKFMVKIMEAILANGLLPFAYHTFRESESKDIISPAQAVIMKLLTNIFRARQARTPSNHLIKSTPPQVDQGDAHMVNFLLTEFRRHIIPQTCALIFLQGQIRAGHAQPEDFPLNLWDMERMYEGVYQYLEFFAILTEHETWKTMLSNWEVAYELVTLLKELDAAIPKGQITVPPLSSATRQPAPAQPVGTEPAPVTVERPYDTTANPTAPEGYMPSPRPFIDEAQDEPSEFEWRNLKKLAVLVMSSLVWKNRQVQDQIRPLGGIEAVLNCCSYDEHNPYIREHAIMCLRFLMEGNKENQDRIRALERYEKERAAGADPQSAPPNLQQPSPATAPSSSSKAPVSVRVPEEVLDQQGYETYMDPKGQVLLRKREVKPPTAPVVGHTAKGKAKLETRDPKDLEQLVQQVMRELPAKVQGVRHDAEKAAALAKLDREFDGKG